MEVAVVGGSEFIIGFLLAGIRKTHRADTREDLIEKIQGVLKDPDVGILVMHADGMKQLPIVLQEKLVESIRPVTITIGEIEVESIREKIKSAIGIDVYGSAS